MGMIKVPIQKKKKKKVPILPPDQDEELNIYRDSEHVWSLT